MDGESDEVEHQQHVGQAFLAVSEVVFEVVSVVLEFVEGFVFDFPSASCAIKQLLDVVSRDRDGGDEVAFVGFASVAMDLQCHPVDAHRLVAVPDWHVVEPLVDSGFLLSPRISRLYMQLFQLDALMVFVQSGKLGFLGGEDEVCTMLLDNGLANRLAGVQGVAEIDRPEGLVFGRIAIQPSFQRVEFAVLLGCIVLWLNELRPQRHHAVVAGVHQRGRKYCVKILNLASATAGSSAAQLAMHLGGAMKLSAVQRDQASPAQPAKRLQSSRLLSQHRQCRVKHSVERLRRNPVQTLANVVVARNPSHPEQRGRTAVAIAALSHSPLVRQKRRRLHEEHRKGRHGNVAEAILRVPAAARILQLFHASAHLANQNIHHRIHGGKLYHHQSKRSSLLSCCIYSLIF